MSLRALYEVPAPAKLNLFLHVIGRRADGYHLLQSVFVLIDWCDTLHFERRDDARLQRHDLGATLPDDDLCLRAARALQCACGTKRGVDILVEKSIPWGGGLGGGRSDAGSTLLALNQLFPTVTGELSAYNKDLDDVIGGEVEDNRALVRLNWSLSAGGAEFAKVDKAKEDGARSKAHKDELLRRIEATIRTAYADLEATDQQKEISLQRLKSNEDLLGAYHAQFEGGKVRILQLLQAENQVLNARLEALNAEYRALAAEYSVLGSVGQMQNKLALNTQSSHVK